MRISKVEKERYNRSRRNDRSWCVVVAMYHLKTLLIVGCRGGDRGRRGGGRRDQTDRKQKSANELDEEMDAYMKNTGDTVSAYLQPVSPMLLTASLSRLQKIQKCLSINIYHFGTMLLLCV